jgi:CTD kinase subunit alpha
MKTHRRVVLPTRKLREDWAKADFVYYPRADGQSVVGAGTYGKVFKAHNVYLNKCVALKTLPLVKPRRKLLGGRSFTSRDKKGKRQERWVKDGLHLTSLREIKLLKSVSHQHENIVGIREIFLEGGSCNLVFDYFEFDMHGIIYSAKVGLNEAMLKDVCRQVFQGLEFLHDKALILHRDIKAANILVSAAGQVRITDFGLAKQVKSQAELDSLPSYRKKFEHSNRVITTPYRPPELFMGATLYGGEVDVWSAGCVLFEAFLKKLPFQGTGEDVDHLLTIWKILGLPNVRTYPEVAKLEWYWLFMTRVVPKKSIFARLYQNKVSPELFHLLRCIFQHNPKKRPTAAQVLSHAFFTTESPRPESARAVLSTVEGEWHELEYKMIRDKEKASVRRKHEDNVILGYLRHKQADHERKVKDAILDVDTENHLQRIDFYKKEYSEFQGRIEARPKTDDKDDDHAKQVAEMKRTHGDMYMDSSRRGRYRGPVRGKADEKLLHEAFRWYEDEKRRGNNPVPAPAATTTVTNRMSERPRESAPTTPVKKAVAAKVAGGPKSLLKTALKGSEVQQSSSASTPKKESQSKRTEKKAEYERKKAAYDDQMARYQAKKASAMSGADAGERSGTGGHDAIADKRSASSPLVDEREAKRAREREEEEEEDG